LDGDSRTIAMSNYLLSNEIAEEHYDTEIDDGMRAI